MMITMKSYLTDRFIYSMLFLALVGIYLGVKWMAGYVGWGMVIAGCVVVGVVVYHKWIKGGPVSRKDLGIYANTSTYKYCYKCGTRLYEDEEKFWWCPCCDWIPEDE